MKHTVKNCDCIELLKSLPAGSIDSVVTDPPSSIEIFGNEWDSDKGGRAEWVAWLASVFVEAKRALKPNAWVCVWALPRRSHWTATAIEDAGFEIVDVATHIFCTGVPKSKNVLKPATEHWILARVGKPSLNVESCRIPLTGDENLEAIERQAASKTQKFFKSAQVRPIYNPAGRYPANLICSSPDLLGSKACFFYCPKPSKRERGEGNTHPTVKPVALMRWLARLVTPPGGVVFDPFTGSGSTGVACKLEGFGFVGAEQDPGYCKIARGRIGAAKA